MINHWFKNAFLMLRMIYFKKKHYRVVYLKKRLFINYAIRELCFLIALWMRTLCYHYYHYLPVFIIFPHFLSFSRGRFPIDQFVHTDIQTTGQTWLILCLVFEFKKWLIGKIIINLKNRSINDFRNFLSEAYLIMQEFLIISNFHRDLIWIL